MTKQDQLDFKRLIIDALSSKEGQKAIVDALKSKEGQEALVDSHVDYFHDVVEPVLDDILYEIKTLKTEVKYMKDNHGSRIDRMERKMGVAI